MGKQRWNNPEKTEEAETSDVEPSKEAVEVSSTPIKPLVVVPAGVAGPIAYPDEPGPVTGPITAGLKFEAQDGNGQKIIYKAVDDPAFHHAGEEPQYAVSGHYLKVTAPGCDFPFEILWNIEKHQPLL